MIIKKIKIPIYEQTLYVSVTEDYSKEEEDMIISGDQKEKIFLGTHLD